MGLNKIMEKTVEENLSAAINVVGKAFGDNIEIYLDVRPFQNKTTNLDHL